jgi:hypothetical protein
MVSSPFKLKVQGSRFKGYKILVSKIFTPLLGLAAFTEWKKHGIRPHRSEVFLLETSSGIITREP